jgi:PAS domain S-box-containing protein
MAIRFTTRKIPSHLIAIFLVLSTGIGIAGFLYYANQKEYIRQEKQNELAAIADLKVNEISRWRRENLKDAENILANPFIKSHIQEWLHNPRADAGKEVNSLLVSLRKNEGYSSVVLLDAGGRIRMAVPDGKETLGPDAKRLAAKAIQTGKIIFSDLYVGKTANVIRLTLVVPLLASKGRDTIPVGALLLRIDPHQFLYALIQSWPTPSSTSETVLLRREGDEILYLNELRHREHTALALRFPISETHLPAVMAAQGMTGVAEGIDYRGIPVIAALRAIPESPWFMVAKVDEEEIYASVRERFWMMVIIMSLLIISAGAGAGFFWRHQSGEFYRRQYEMEFEKNRAEAAFKELYSQQEAILAAVPDIIMRVDSNKVYTWANKAGQEFFGDDVVGREASLYFEGEQDTYETVKPVFNGEEKVIYVESWQRREDGEKRLLAWWCRVLKDSDGRVSGALSTARDITERKWAEEELKRYQEHLEDQVEKRTAELRESWKQYRDLYEGSRDGFVRVDMEGNIKEFNRAYKEMLGYADEELKEITYKDITPDKWHSMEEDVVREQILARGYSEVYEKEYRRKDGTIFPVELRTYLIKDEDGNPSGMWAFIRDITGRKQAEAAIEKLNRELQRRAAELEAMNRELESFSYSVSHDLRAPLRAVSGFSQILLEDCSDRLDREGKEYLRRVHAASQNMSQLIDDLLNLSRVTRGEMRHERVDLSTIARMIAKELQESRPERHVKFIIEERIFVNGDMRLLRIMLRNLMENAFKFTGGQSHATIEFGVTHYHGEPAYCVRDNGAGFDMAYAHKLFGAFQRLHSQAEFPGTGIGLAIVQRIIHRHGGRVWAEGKVNEGATFCFTLP